MKFYKNYLTEVLGHLDVVAQQDQLMIECAKAMADTIMDNGLIHVVGCGHSQMFAYEMFYRAGGLAQVNAILPPTLSLSPYAPMSTFSERQHGLAAIALNAEDDIRKGDILIVVSTSGRNPVPIEFAIEGKKRGMKVIGLVSSAFSNSVKSRHESSQRLGDRKSVV